MNRRAFIKGVAGLGGAALITGFYTWQVEPFWLDIVELNMPIKNLPKHLIGKKLMQISDMHVGNRFDRNFISRSFRKAQTLNPDFVVYTGDFVNWESSEQLGQLDEVFNYAVKGRFKSAGVLGNHDYGRGWAEDHVAHQVVDVLNHHDIAILRNRAIDIEGLNIFGIDDFWATNFNPSKALQYLYANSANLVLCHNPDVVDLNIWNDYDGWILSGHTHGGQCKPPFLDPPLLPVRNKVYTSGVFDLSGGRTLYINRALGHLWQVRFNVRPEITLFHLQQA